MTRRPAPGIVTVAGGGWIASGPPGADRLPTPTYPAGLRWSPPRAPARCRRRCAARGRRGCGVGDRVWFRHAKAGELCEQVDVLHALAGDGLTGTLPTYRGEGRAFG